MKKKEKDKSIVKRTKIVRLDKDPNHIIRLIKNRQHVWNNLVLLYNMYDDKLFRKFLKDGYGMRTYYASHNCQPKKQEAFDKYDKIIKHHAAQDKVFRDFFTTYNNHLFVSIISEFSARIRGMKKLYKEQKAAGLHPSYPHLKSKKIGHMKSGSITIDHSNIHVIHPNEKFTEYYKKYDLVYLTIFTQPYFKKVFNVPSISHAYRFYCKLPNNYTDMELVWKANKVYAHIHYERKRKPVIRGKYSLSMDPGKQNMYTIFSDNPIAPSILLRSHTINKLARIYLDYVEPVRWENLPTYNKNKKPKDFLRPYTSYQHNLDNCLSKFEKHRDLVVRAEAYKFTNRIINYCKKYDIGTIIIGRNKYQKTGQRMSKKQNAEHHTLPHYTFNHILDYKCEELGINLQYQEESYTSQLDALNEQSQVWEYNYVEKRYPTDSVKQLGVRGHRSVYKSRKYNCEFNADVNGAINIMQKYKEKFIDAFTTNHDSIFHPIIVHNDNDFLNLLSN